MFARLKPGVGLFVVLNVCAEGKNVRERNTRQLQCEFFHVKKRQKSRLLCWLILIFHRAYRHVFANKVNEDAEQTVF